MSIWWVMSICCLICVCGWGKGVVTASICAVYCSLVREHISSKLYPWMILTQSNVWYTDSNALSNYKNISTRVLKLTFSLCLRCSSLIFSLLNRASSSAASEATPPSDTPSHPSLFSLERRHTQHTSIGLHHIKLEANQRLYFKSYIAIYMYMQLL